MNLAINTHTLTNECTVGWETGQQFRSACKRKLTSCVMRWSAEASLQHNFVTGFNKKSYFLIPCILVDSR